MIRRLGVLVALAVSVPVPARSAAQTPSQLAASCASAGGVASACRAAAVAGQAVAGDVALAAGFGSEVSGTASNLGQRVSGAPRLAFGARAGLVRAGTPRLSDPTGASESSFTVPTMQASVTAGLFDGLRVMPTVAGFLALDAFARAVWIRLPSAQGFDGATTAYSVGVRVGLFRESFTLPGLSVSVSRRFVGSTSLVSGTSGDPVEVTVDPSVTSVRATLGKDLFAVEVLAGFGWDDYSSDVGYRVTDGAGGIVDGAGSLDMSRRLYFVSGSTSFNIVFALTVEAGLARGFAPVAGWTGRFDPGSSTPFGSLSLRLTI